MWFVSLDWECVCDWSFFRLTIAMIKLTLLVHALYIESRSIVPINDTHILVENDYY